MTPAAFGDDAMGTHTALDLGGAALGQRGGGVCSIDTALEKEKRDKAKAPFRLPPFGLQGKEAKCSRTYRVGR